MSVVIQLISKLVKQEVNGSVILPPLVFPGLVYIKLKWITKTAFELQRVEDKKDLPWWVVVLESA